MLILFAKFSSGSRLQSKNTFKKLTTFNFYQFFFSTGLKSREVSNHLIITSLGIRNSYIVWNPKSVSKLLFLASFPQGRLIKLSSCRRKQARRERKKKVPRASIIVNYVNWPLEWGQNAVFALHSWYNFRIVIAL